MLIHHLVDIGKITAIWRIHIRYGQAKMKRLFLAIIILMSCNPANDSEYDQDAYFEFVKLNQDFEIKVLNYSPAPFSCGSMATAAQLIGERLDGDTIRVLLLCYEEKIRIGSTITIEIDNNPDFGVLAGHNVPPNELEKIKLPTTYGKVKPGHNTVHPSA